MPERRRYHNPQKEETVSRRYILKTIGATAAASLLLGGGVIAYNRRDTQSTPNGSNRALYPTETPSWIQATIAANVPHLPEGLDKETIAKYHLGSVQRAASILMYTQNILGQGAIFTDEKGNISLGTVRHVIPQINQDSTLATLHTSGLDKYYLTPTSSFSNPKGKDPYVSSALPTDYLDAINQMISQSMLTPLEPDHEQTSDNDLFFLSTPGIKGGNAILNYSSTYARELRNSGKPFAMNTLSQQTQEACQGNSGASALLISGMYPSLQEAIQSIVDGTSKDLTSSNGKIYGLTNKVIGVLNLGVDGTLDNSAPHAGHNLRQCSTALDFVPVN